MKIGILTMLNNLRNTNSTVNIVAEQLKMFLDANIDVKIIVSEDCHERERKDIFLDERIEWAKVRIGLRANQVKNEKSLFEEVDVMAKEFIEILAGVDICIMYKIHCEEAYLIYNIAIRTAQEKLPDIKFIAMNYSIPLDKRPQEKWPFSAMYTSMPNTIYVCPTYAEISLLAKRYDIPEGKCKVINSSVDLFRGLSDPLKNISKHIDLISPDILIVYPAELIKEKKFDKIAALGGIIFSKTEKSVKIVFCDFPGNELESEIYKGLIKKIGYIHGLEEEDIVFTSDLGYQNGLPREGIMDLFTISNLFICPSYEETLGNSVLEAASRGNCIVLNEAIPQLEELGKNLHSYFMRWDAGNFGYETKEKYNPSELAYLQEHSERIVNMMRDNSVIYSKTITRQRYSPEWIFKNQIEPLISDK